MEILLKINSNKIQKDNNIFEMDTCPVLNLEQGRTMVPLRAIAEMFGFDVQWINDTQEIIIRDRKKYFETVDECAFDWAMHWNAMSIALFREMGGIIYQDSNGYYWDSVKIGKDKEVYWGIPEVRKGVAFIHSHGGGMHGNTKTMSGADFRCAKDCARPLYMVDSGGYLHKYDPSGEKKQITVREGAPCDIRWMNIDKNVELMKQYFNNNYQELNDYKDLGFKADFYNKLFMNKLSYMTERAVI